MDMKSISCSDTLNLFTMFNGLHKLAKHLVDAGIMRAFFL